MVPTAAYSLVMVVLSQESIPPERVFNFRWVICNVAGLASSLQVTLLKPGCTLLVCSTPLYSLTSNKHISHLTSTMTNHPHCHRWHSALARWFIINRKGLRPNSTEVYTQNQPGSLGEQQEIHLHVWRLQNRRTAPSIYSTATIKSPHWGYPFRWFQLSPTFFLQT